MSRSELVGTSSAERTLDQRDLASLRPAKENAPRTRKPRVLREVTSGIVCFCGERFGEHQALEFMLHLRAEVGEELDWAQKERTRKRAYFKNRYATDPEYRERRRKESYERWRVRRADPEVRQRENERARERYRTDPEYRERISERRQTQRADPEVRERRNASERERRRNDPEWRESERQRKREAYARKKAERKAAKP